MIKRMVVNKTEEPRFNYCDHCVHKPLCVWTRSEKEFLECRFFEHVDPKFRKRRKKND